MSRTTGRISDDAGSPDALEERVLHNRPLWKQTSIRAGGPAHVYVRPTDLGDLRAALQWAKRRDCDHVILGAGSNVVFSDSGYSGLVIHTIELLGRRLEGTRVRAVAGEMLAGVAWWVTRLGLSGLEWACGIPGSIGGAVVMNAGAADSNMAAVLSSVDVLVEEDLLRLPVESIGLGYRTSSLLTGDLRGTVVEVAIDLRRDDPAACLQRARSSIEDRLRRFPVGASAGCIFRNPGNGPTAGELLDRAGCKGMRVGRAAVSTRHANVVVNEGSNNANDILTLIEWMKRRVLDAYGVVLREEVVRFDRESSDPLRTDVR